MFELWVTSVLSWNNGIIFFIYAIFLHAQLATGHTIYSSIVFLDLQKHLEFIKFQLPTPVFFLHISILIIIISFPTIVEKEVEFWKQENIYIYRELICSYLFCSVCLSVCVSDENLYFFHLLISVKIMYRNYKMGNQDVSGSIFGEC